MPTPSLYVTHRLPPQVEARLLRRYDVKFNESGATVSPDVLKSVLGSYDAVCVSPSDTLTAEVLAARSARMRILANNGVGVSHIDLAECARLGIVVTNTPDVLTESTADTALMLMLMVARRAGEGERLVRARGWKRGREAFLGAEVSGKSLGIVGFGRIGQALARKARLGLSMSVAYYSHRRATAQAEAASGARHCNSLEELLEGADFVSLHCPGGAGTRHLIDGPRLSRMRRSAFLINTARGEVVDEAALIAALQGGTLAGAGLDVFENEPQVPEALLALDNVVLLPHMGSATVETRTAMGMRVAENLDRFFEGREPRDRVV